jgi:Icc protein
MSGVNSPEPGSYLKRFASVTCLNGHVHQIMSHTDGKVTFHTAAPTCYPLPRAGNGPAPQPLVVPAGQLRQALGIRDVKLVTGTSGLALKEEMLV